MEDSRYPCRTELISLQTLILASSKLGENYLKIDPSRYMGWDLGMIINRQISYDLPVIRTHPYDGLPSNATKPKFLMKRDHHIRKVVSR